MTQDREAVVWTRLGGHPLRMGLLYVTDTECRFTYDSDFLNSGLPGLGLVLSPEIFKDRTIGRRRTERFDLPPPIQALVPPKDQGNFQRNIALRCLQERGITNLSGFDADWEILKLSGHGGIGHVDVFEDDDAARDWYGKPWKHQFFDVDDESDFSLKDFLTWFDGDAHSLIHLIGPTPSVGGAIPKLLVSIPATGWDGRIGLPTRGPTANAVDVVLKFEQTATYPGITELEALALDVHRQLGFEVPRYWLCTFKGIPAIAIERFDRDAQQHPVFTETLFSILASGNPDMRNHYDFSYDGISKALELPEVPLVTDKRESRIHLFRRLVAAFLTGNGDLHLENLSILAAGGQQAFSPVYDPTPMRAYPIHNMLNVMPFGRYGDFVTGQDAPVGFQEAMANFARSCDITQAKARSLVEEIVEDVADYPDRVDALNRLPGENKRLLVDIHAKMQDQLLRCFRSAS